MVYTLAYRIIKNREDAEEVSQDVFIKAYQSIKSFKGDSKFSTWLYKIAYHRSLDYLKKNKRTLNTYTLDSDSHIQLPALEDIWGDMVARERVETIRKALEKLPGDDGVLLTLFYYEGLSLKEITEIAGVSLNTLKVRMHRSRKRLALLLQNKLDEQIIPDYHGK